MIFWMLIGVAFYSLIIGIIGAFFTNRLTKNSMLYLKLLKLETFAKETNLSRNLVEELRKSILYSSKKVSYLWADKKHDIFWKLPENLKYEFLKATNTDLVLKNSFFSRFNKEFAVKIIPLLKPVLFNKGEFIWEEGDFSS